jgi:hypothetical protein
MAGRLRSESRHQRSRTSNGGENDHLEDVNLDGYMNLVAHYFTRQTGIGRGDESATLTGKLLDGQTIEGTVPVIGVWRSTMSHCCVLRELPRGAGYRTSRLGRLALSFDARGWRPMSPRAPTAVSREKDPARWDPEGSRTSLWGKPKS